eukprot:4752132-Prorocentrum_lima.AAC.1
MSSWVAGCVSSSCVCCVLLCGGSCWSIAIVMVMIVSSKSARAGRLVGCAAEDCCLCVVSSFSAW